MSLNTDDFSPLETKPLARWTIGPSTPDGYESLALSVEAFTSLYDVDVVVCHNCPPENLPTRVARFPKFDQRPVQARVRPTGVAWKLHPPRLAPSRHEIQIDNDVILADRVPQIDEFFNGDCTLLLGAEGRTYGRFERHVPPGFAINSGIFGVPPGFDLQRYVDFYAGEGWEKNAFAEHDANETFDEQGLVAFALLSYRRCVIIPSTTVTNCEHHLREGLGYHFIGLNRRKFHRPYRLYRCRRQKLYL